MKKPAGKTDRDKRDDSAADDDAEHFAREMRDVVRLPPDPRGRARARAPITSPRTDNIRGATDSRIRSASARHTVAQSAEAAGSLPDDAAFVAPGVDRRELRKLRRGEHVPGSRLDLHGMTGAEAVARVKRLIDAHRHRHRCICIVHGRGLHSEGNVSILKTRVREYLRQHPAVLAYADAPPEDGGPGAVYVLLRK